MSVERDLVRRIAELARLRFEEDELEVLTGELNKILDHVEALRAVPEEGQGGAGAYATGSVRTMRADETGAPDPLGSEPRQFAPAWADGFFVVPPPPGVRRTELEDGS